MLRSKNYITELKMILSKMPLDVCCSLVLPEFEVSWRDVSKSIHSARLAMAPMNVARILCRYASKTMDPEELAELVARLRLKLVATQSRTWHVVRLSDPVDEPLDVLSQTLALELMQGLRVAKGYRNMRPKVQIISLNDLVYVSIQMVSNMRDGPTLFMALPPGLPVALVNTVRSGLLKLCVQALGYQSYEDLNLFGKDVHSLLRIYNTSNTELADHLSGMPEYRVMPVVTRSGIDYTGKSYNEQYVREILGPNPPVLTKLSVTANKDFFDLQRLNKEIKITLNLTSDNVAESLCNWAKLGALHPTSELFQVFLKIKSNKIYYAAGDNDT